jgi:hypothetical protein
MCMEKATIRLLYRKIIDNNAADIWEKHVFDETYKEFLMQVQNYNREKKYFTYGELIHHVPGAEKLNFLVSASIIGYLKQLKGIVPDIINNSGKRFLPFKNYKFEIINSDTRDKSRHQIAVNFISEPLAWYDTIDNRLLVAIKGDEATVQNGEVLTEMFTMQPHLSIFSLKRVNAS